MELPVLRLAVESVNMEWKERGLTWIRQFRVRRLGFIGVGVLSFFSLLVDWLTIKSMNFQVAFDYQGYQNKTIPKFTVKHSLLNDKTVTWDPTVDRMWLDPSRRDRRPPAMMLLTSMGWNRFDQNEALQQYSRQTRESELLDGIINHPWFHPTAWDDIENGDNITIQSILGIQTNNDDDLNATTPTMSTRFYLFLDVSSDCDVHYPYYHLFDVNLDTTGGRVNVSTNLIYQSIQAVQHPIWSQSKFITQLGANNLNQMKLIYFDCNGEMHPNFAETRRNHGVPVVVAHLSGTIARSDEAIDMGLVAPILNGKFELSESEIESIYNCAADYDETQRPYYITYIGNFRSRPRWGFNELNDNKRMFGLRYFLDEFKESSIANVSYEDILKQSIYSGAPRGDNKYSYRFTEILASGGIPIVLADDWMLPFRPELVHWDECIILLPENESGLKMLKHIAPITVSERCERRKKCYDIYRNYMETGRKVIDGIVQGLELVGLGYRANMTAIHCDPSNPNPDECNPNR
jgi:hypothetical protein